MRPDRAISRGVRGTGPVMGVGMLRPLLRAMVVTLLAVSAVTVAGPSALADPALPTHYRSTVTSVQTSDGSEVALDARVAGGDAFLVAEVPWGSELVVEGYQGEPYLRVGSEGLVEVNERSPARWLNDARYGGAEVEVPPRADADAPPEWVVAAGGGRYAWHDHRIHFMAPSLPSQVDPALDEEQQVWPWEVPVTFDGEAARITGELVWVPGPGPGLPILAFVVILAGVLLLVRRGPGLLASASAAAAAGGLVVGVANNLGLPPGMEGRPVLLGLPLAALAILGVGIGLVKRGDIRGRWLIVLSTVPSLVVGVLISGAVTRPFVPGELPAAAVRLLSVALVAIAVAVLVDGARRVLAATSLDAATGPASGEESPGAP